MKSTPLICSLEVGTIRLCSPPTVSIFDHGIAMIFDFFKILFSYRVSSNFSYTEGRCEDPVRVNEDPRAHVFEGIGNSSDGDYVRELSLAGVLSPMDPGPGPRHAASKRSMKSEDHSDK